MTSRGPSNGRLLQLIALGHAVVGALVYPRELGEIGRRRLVGSVGFRGGRSSAFWFMAPAPLLWMLGGLLHRAERADDADALRSTSATSLICAVIATICMPVSGFWLWIGVSARGLRDARTASFLDQDSR
ncbi:MAG TPA: DUF6463 family protein [Solirubrobacterales bacterium]